jgi:hypothetical protein
MRPAYGRRRARRGYLPFAGRDPPKGNDVAIVRGIVESDRKLGTPLFAMKISDDLAAKIVALN